MRNWPRYLKLLEESEARYAQRQTERTQNQEHIRNGQIREANEPERFQKRLERLEIDPAAATGTSRDAAEFATGVGRQAVDGAFSALERILGRNNLLGIDYLENGLVRARAVARIEISDRIGFVGHGTGFLVSPRLLLTNNHVLESAQTAATSRCEFNFQLDINQKPRRSTFFAFAPDEFFVTDVDLDFTLVAVQTPNAQDQRLDEFGQIALIDESGKIVNGEKVNIIQHPGGQLKQVALHDNQLVDILGDFLHYESDTMRGSSGSPVFNDQWEAVALHHSGVPKRNEEGKILNKSGGLWTEIMGDDQIWWLANEGVRISRIVAFLRDRQPQLTPDARVLLSGALGEGTANDAPAEPSGAGGGTTSGIPQSTRHDAERPDADGGDQSLNERLREALAILAESGERTYYDAEQDRRDRDVYYAAVGSAAPAENAFSFTADDGRTVTLSVSGSPATGERGTPGFEQLHTLLRTTHVGTPRYEPSRHVYPWVDLHGDGKLRSIYSGKVYDPTEFIEADIATMRHRQEEMALFRARQETEPSPAVLEAQAALLESRRPYNCEHVVPQSWFGRREPMRGDLHHLFACEVACNSFRSNIPYFDFEDFGEALRSDCGKRLDTRFEPEAGKGTAARAVMYFLLRYPGQIDDTDSEFERERLPTLLKWHRDFPVDEYELHRNMAIFAVQGNRNPLVDFPEWAELIDFTKGLG